MADDLSAQLTENTTPAGRNLRVSLVLGLSLGLAVLALLLFGWLATAVMRGATLPFDLEVRNAAHSLSSPPLTRAMVIVTLLGSPQFLIAATGMMVVVFLAAGWHRAAAWLVLAMVGAAALDLTMKPAFHRTRPAPFFGVALPRSASFPSGHALASFCFYAVIAALCAARVRGSSFRASIWVAAGVLIVAIGFSRVYLGVHFFTDVLGGYLAAAMWVGALAFTDRAYARRRRKVHSH